jgi:hypothetical protein
MIVKAKKLFNKATKDGVIILSDNEEDIFSLNETAASIWKFVGSRHETSMDDIVDMLMKEYIFDKKDLENCRKDCLSIIKSNPELFEILKDRR